MDLSPEKRAVLEPHRKSIVSVFEVAETRPEIWELDLDDRLGKRNTTTVIDRSLSASSIPGTLFFLRLVPYESFVCTSGLGLPAASSNCHEGEREFALKRG